MRTISHPDFAQPVSYTVMPLPEDSSDNQVAATIVVMKQLAKADSRSESERNLAAQLLANCACADDYIAAVFAEAQRRMYFQQDEQTALPIGEAVELLIRPVDIITLSDAGNKVPGDCDCFSTFVASLLLAGGVDCAFATVAADKSDPDTFSHVYVVAWPNSPDRIAVDASHGRYAGWEAPNCGRYQEWSLNSPIGANCAELLLMGLIFVAGFIFNWGDNNSGNYEREAIA